MWFCFIDISPGKKEEQILGSTFFLGGEVGAEGGQWLGGLFCASTFVIKMINADLAVMLIEIGRETLNINQTCFFIIIYLTSLFPPCTFIPLLSFGSSRHKGEILCVKIYRTVSFFYLLIL